MGRLILVLGWVSNRRLACVDLASGRFGNMDELSIVTTFVRF